MLFAIDWIFYSRVLGWCLRRYSARSLNASRQPFHCGVLKNICYRQGHPESGCDARQKLHRKQRMSAQREKIILNRRRIGVEQVLEIAKKFLLYFTRRQANLASFHL